MIVECFFNDLKKKSNHQLPPYVVYTKDGLQKRWSKNLVSVVSPIIRSM